MHRQCRAHQRGSAILEGALVYGAFFFMLIASIDFGQVMFTHQNLKERVRSAARWGIANHNNANLVTSVQNLVLYGSTTLSGDAPTPSTLLGMTADNVKVTRVAGGYAAPDRLTVRVTGYKYYFLTPTIAGLKKGNDIVITLPMENP